VFWSTALPRRMKAVTDKVVATSFSFRTNPLGRVQCHICLPLQLNAPLVPAAAWGNVKITLCFHLWRKVVIDRVGTPGESVLWAGHPART
jgi:hypothetical protein